jgi:hypothetical protein
MSEIVSEIKTVDLNSSVCGAILDLYNELKRTYSDEFLDIELEDKTAYLVILSFYTVRTVPTIRFIIFCDATDDTHPFYVRRVYDDGSIKIYDLSAHEFSSFRSQLLKLLSKHYRREMKNRKLQKRCIDVVNVIIDELTQTDMYKYKFIELALDYSSKSAILSIFASAARLTANIYCTEEKEKKIKVSILKDYDVIKSYEFDFEAFKQYKQQLYDMFIQAYNHYKLQSKR